MTKIPQNAVHPSTRAEWREWLAINHQRGKGVWLISFKKATGKTALSYLGEN